MRRNEEQGAHIYEAAISMEATQKQLAGDLLERGFGGSAARLMQGALSGRKASKAELAELRKVMTEFEKGVRRFFQLFGTLFAKPLGLTLVHSLWETAGISFLLLTALTLFRSPLVRYAVAYSSLLASLAAFALTLYRLTPGDGPDVTPY